MQAFYTFLCFLCLTCSLHAQPTTNWTTPTEVAMSMYGNLRPRVVVAANDKPIVMWGDGSTKSIYVSRWTGTEFGAPVKVNPLTMHAFYAYWAGADIAAKGGTVYVVFKEMDEENTPTWICKSTDGGATFGAPVAVHGTGFVSRFPTVTIDEDGNPLVGFMKFSSGWLDAHWVVARSEDGGNSFLPDVLASEYSGGEACDCCSGSLALDGNQAAMLYRDNDSNIRDIWAGLSSDWGANFPQGSNVDDNNWCSTLAPPPAPTASLPTTRFTPFL